MAEFDSSITAYFGGDLTGLASAVTGAEKLVTTLEGRFEEMGVNIGDVPKKFASESAKAFEDIFAAEKKVADFRRESVYEQMSNEDKLKTVQLEATGIRERINAIEGNTVEKQALQLQYEQKKRTIYDLNKTIAAEITKEQKNQSEEAAKQTGLIGMLEKGVHNVKDAFKAVGVGIKGIGLGVFLAQAINLGKQAIEAAQKQREEYERLGKPIDTATRSMAVLGDAIDGVKKAGVTSVGFFISGYTQIGDVLGSVINRMRGISEAQENYAMQSERLAKLQEERIKQLKLEQHDLDRIASAKKALMDQEEKSVFDQANAEKQFQILTEKRLKLIAQIANTERDTVAWYERRNKLVEVTAEIEKKRVDLVKQSAEEQLQALKTQEPLAITFEEKKASLLKERTVLTEELNKLVDGSAEKKAAQLKLDANAVAMQKMVREQLDAQVLDLETRVELQKIAMGISKLDVDAQSELVAKADKLNELKLTQYRISELQKKQLYEGLNPEEEKRLRALYEQEQTLNRQITAIERQNDPAKRLNELARQWNMISNDQLGVMEAQIAAAISMAQAEGQVTSELEKQLDLVRQIRSSRDKKDAPLTSSVTGADVAGFVRGQSSDALRGMVDKLEKQLNSLGNDGLTQIKNATINGNYGDFLTASTLRYQLGAAQNELKQRDLVSGYVERFGEGQARYQYGDAVVERALRDVQDVGTQTVTAIRGLSKQLSSSGLFPSSNV